MAPSSSSSAAPSVWQIVRRALAEAPERTRVTLAVIGGAWFLMIGLQVLDIRGRTGPPVVAEMLSVLLGTTGTVLLGLMQALESTTRGKAGDGSGRPDDSPALRQVLIALPTLGFVVAALLAAALALLTLRAVLGATLAVMAPAGALYLTFLVMAGLSVAGTTRSLYRYAEERAAAAARAEAQAAEAQLAALQAQMNPHFLFNALNTVAALVRTDPPAAEATVENLADVLRLTLRRSAETLRTLGDEIDYLRAYLAVEQQRVGDRVRVRWTVPEELRSAELPPMTLQPLVENAMKHGVGSRIEGGELRIEATVKDGRLRLVVGDDGPGFARGYREGTGLGNLRRRLATLYGPEAILQASSEVAGSRVVIELPLRQ